jgi:hypothetical protein
MFRAVVKDLLPFGTMSIYFLILMTLVQLQGPYRVESGGEKIMESESFGLKNVDQRVIRI